jgi:hypothetical protein
VVFEQRGKHDEDRDDQSLLPTRISKDISISRAVGLEKLDSNLLKDVVSSQGGAAVGMLAE